MNQNLSNSTKSKFNRWQHCCKRNVKMQFNCILHWIQRNSSSHWNGNADLPTSFAFVFRNVLVSRWEITLIQLNESWSKQNKAEFHVHLFFSSLQKWIANRVNCFAEFDLKSQRLNRFNFNDFVGMHQVCKHLDWDSFNNHLFILSRLRKGRESKSESSFDCNP